MNPLPIIDHSWFPYIHSDAPDSHWGVFVGLMVDGSGAWFKFKFANAVITFYLATGGVRLRSCAGICSLQCRQGCTELGALFCRSLWVLV